MGFIVMLCIINVKTANAQLRRNILSIFAPVRRRKSPHTKRARRNQTSPRSFPFFYSFQPAVSFLPPTKSA